MSQPGTDVYNEVMWAPWRDLGLEHVRLFGTPDGVRIIGLVMRRPNASAGFRYVIDADNGFSLRSIVLEPLDRPGWTLVREQDETWRTGEKDNELGALRGCADVDLSLTPLTNSLILRRLDLAINASADVCVVRIVAPELQVQRREQRYTRTGERSYRLEEAQGETEFVVDQEVVVLDWPAHYRRVWSLDKDARRLRFDRDAVRIEQLLKQRKRRLRG